MVDGEGVRVGAVRFEDLCGRVTVRKYGEDVRGEGAIGLGTTESQESVATVANGEREAVTREDK